MDLNSTDSNFQDIHERQPLLKQRGIITMPYYMDYDSFKEVAWALDFWKFDSVLSGRPIIKFIGNGGNFSATTAIGELMRDYNAIGILAGGSYSGHTIAFMMCPERYVYDSAYFEFTLPAYTQLIVRTLMLTFVLKRKPTITWTTRSPNCSQRNLSVTNLMQHTGKRFTKKPDSQRS